MENKKENGAISFGRPYINFVLSLVDFSKVKRILLLTGIIDITAMPIDVRDKIETVSIEQNPHEALQDKENFDLTIIVPNFGRVSRGQLEFPLDWELSDYAAAHIEDCWLAWGIKATKQDGQILCITSKGMLNSTLRRPIRQKAIDKGLFAVISLGATYKPETSVNSALLLIKCGSKSNDLSLINVSQVSEETDWIELGSHIKKQDFNITATGFWSTKISTESLTDSFRLEPDFYHPRFLQIEPPSGFTEVLLSDIAEIRGGRPLSSFQADINTDEPFTHFLQVSNITTDGKLSLEFAKTFPVSQKNTSQSGWAQPGDILITVAGTLGKVFIIPENYSNGLYYDTSIRRIRVNNEIVPNEDVYEFLKSESAQLQISRYASGSVIPIVSTADLGNIRVFLPDLSSQATDSISTHDVVQVIKPPEQFTQVVARTLQDKIVTPLLGTNINQQPNWRNETIFKLREIMQQIQKDHEPLDELVTRYYPLPIAIAFRRLSRAYHNPYEQVNRLTELYETLTQFFYFVLLSDYLRTPDLYSQLQNEKNIKKHVKAYKSFSMNERLGFIKEILEKMRKESCRIFIPEFLQIDPYAPLNSLRLQRNQNAHSTAGTASAQKALFENNWPHIEKLLLDLRFLRNYPLCRIDGYYNKGNKTLFRIEYFQGALYETDYREQEAPTTDDGNVKLIRADSTHVILLNPQFDWLDLHPFYQVVTSQEYRYESHLCFQKLVKDKNLIGESIQFRTELQLPGHDDLHQLVKAVGL